MAVACIDYQINLCLQKLDDPSTIEESLQRLTSMALTAEIMHRTGAGKVLRGYYSHSSHGSLARSIVEEAESTTSPTSSDNESSRSPDAVFNRKRHFTTVSPVSPVSPWKRSRLSSSEGDTDEETFSRQRELTRIYGGRDNEEKSILLERKEKVEGEKNVEVARDEKLRQISQRIAQRSAAIKNGQRKTVSIGSLEGTTYGRYSRLSNKMEKGVNLIPSTSTSPEECNKTNNMSRKRNGPLIIEPLMMNRRK